MYYLTFTTNIMDLNRSLNECNGYKNVLDLTNVTDAMDMLYSSTEKVFFIAVLPVLLSIGVVANTAFIYTVCRVNSMHTITNAYLANVAVADLIFLIFVWVTYFPLYFISPVRNHVFYNSFVGCTLGFWFVNSSYYASSFLITFVTIERYYAICRPLKHRMVASKSRTRKLIVLGWVLGLIFGGFVAPRLGGFIRYCVKWPKLEQFSEMPETIEFCKAAHSVINIFSEIFRIVPHFTAMFANIYFYGAIIITLSRRPGIKSKVGQPQALKIRNQVAKLLIANGTLFFLCQTPVRLNYIHTMVVQLGGAGLFNVEQYGIVLIIGRCFLFLNAFINPFVYVAMSSFYRNAFKEAFTC